MRYKLFKFLIAFTLLIVPSLVSASQWSEIVPDGRLLEKKDQQIQNYRLALGAPEKINGTWLLERELVLDGSLLSWTVEVTSGSSVQELKTQSTNYMAQLGAMKLFQCEGLDCGSSSAWANDHFRIKQLYGFDTAQHLWVWELRGENKLEYVTAYLVKRGNRRVYFHLEVMASGLTRPAVVPDARVIYEDLKQNGVYSLRRFSSTEGHEIKLDLEEIKVLVSALARLPGSKVGVLVTGFNASAEHASALSHAETVAKTLVSQGLPARRLQSTSPASEADESSDTPAINIELLK